MADSYRAGTLYGLGIGPGDPDLITLKARDILARVPVVAYPAPEGGESLVRAIAAPHVPAGLVEIVIETPMAVDRFPAREVYDRYAAILAGHLDGGRDVAVLCEGDPFFYGSFMYLYERLADRYPAVVVPGVSSLTAVAAAAGVPLASRNEVLAVLPAPLPEAELEARLARSEAAAIIKVGRHLPKVRAVLRRLGLEADARYVERATMATQRVLPLADVGAGPAPYFSTILVHRPHAAHAASASGLPQGAALIALSAGGEALARRLQPTLPGSRVHGLAGRTEAPDEPFGDTMTHLRALFAAGTPIVGVCAAGILIRATAPLLADKRAEPPMVAVAEDGSAAVPLLGGHHGANRLARAIAAALGGVAAVTTAGDVRFGFGLDDPPPGWRVANPEAAKAVSAAMLAGRPVALRVEAGDTGWLARSGARFSADGEAAVLVTDRAVRPALTPPLSQGERDGVRGSGKPFGLPPPTLVLHPPVLALGVGCERGADPEELLALVRGTLAEHALAEGAIACVASLDLKADEDAVHAVADALGVPARFFPAAELEAEAARLANPSDVVFREVGCHGVAEGAALAAAGTEGTLVVEKTRSRRATCAVARAPGAIDATAVGRARGRLVVVGIGPGAATWRTAEATRALSEATDVVGYRLYLDLIADLTAGKRLHTAPLAEEEQRVRMALDLAAEGCRVALVSSGDAGIYALAALVFELLDREDRPPWNRLAVVVAPGISALQAAAARAGAVIGHDFCAVSLSDLLTPWPDIERRLRAAADGDFVVALYNPVSQRRRTQLEAARDLLLQRRPADTPVVLARNLGREGESLRFVELKDLTPDLVDMLTVVLVGSSRTKLIERGGARGGRRFVYTPRGYAAKQQPAKQQPAAPGEEEKAAEMTVHFIGAGPGAPDLITVRGLNLIRRCPVCLYAGSLVPREVVAEAPPDARVIDTAPLHLDEIVDEMRKAHAAGEDVARVHSGDPSLYGATGEQMRRLDALGIAYDVTPGVPAYAAAAAALNCELTLPEVSQTVVLTRTATRSSPMPKGEDLATLGASGATLAIHLSATNLANVVRELAPLYGADCPVVVAYRVGWPDQAFLRGTLADIRDQVKAAGITRTGLILVGRVLGGASFPDSRLYAADHHHVLRPRRSLDD